MSSLVAATTFVGLGAAGQTLLPGFVGTAHAQASTWSFVGPAPDTTGKPAAGSGQPDRSPWGDTSGRLNSVVTVPDNPSVVYVGSAGGGVWKSTDAGQTWKSLNDNTDSSVRTGSSEAIGSLWTNKTGQTVLAGTGDAESGSESSQYGTGVLESTDGGGTWKALGRGTFARDRISGISGDRTGLSTRVLAATDKGLYTSPNSGLFWRQVTDLTDQIPSRTTFTQTGTSVGLPKQKTNLANPYRGVGALVTVAGVKWTQVPSFAGESATAKVYTLTESGGVWTLRFGDGINGAIPPKGDQISIFYSAPGAISGQVFQIEQDPTIATKYWASFGDSCRTESGGVATSDDSGATWTVVRSDPDAGRVGLGVGADGKTAYASRAKCNGALLDIEKTTTGGGIGTWKATAVKPPNYFHFTSNDENGQGNYDNVTAVDPTDANRAAFGGVSILTTSDGGGKFTDAGRVNDNPSGAIHPDFHALAFTGAKTFYAGEDGGLYSTTDMGGTGQPADWTNLNGGADPTKRLAITQFYSGAALTSTNLLGGTQDNGSVYPNGGTSALPTMTDITSSDGFFTAIDPTVDPTNPTAVTLYTEYPFMGIRRLTGTPPNFTDTRISPCGGGGGGSAGRCVAGEINDPVAFGAPFVKDPLDPQNLTGTTTAGSAQVTNVSSLVGLRVGESFSGEGIPANTTILFVGTNWAPSRAFALGQTIVGGGHTQKVTTAGTSGTTQPTWNTSGGTTDDGTVVWTDEGPTSAKVLRLSNQATAPGSSFTAGGGRLLAGSARVWETTNARSSAPTWKAISPALTKTTTGTLSFIALPPTGGNTIFTTSNDGAVFRTTDGTTWTDITGNLPGLSNSFTNPARKPFFTSVAFNPTNSAEAWVTAGVLGVGRVYHTLNADQGANTTWVDQTGTGGGVLPDAPVLSVVQKPGTDTIDLGTYYGVWECTQCAGKNTAVAWHRLGTKLPINVDVDKLTVSNDKKSLVAWTFGRGIWTLPLS